MGERFNPGASKAPRLKGLAGSNPAPSADFLLRKKIGEISPSAEGGEADPPNLPKANLILKMRII